MFSDWLNDVIWISLVIIIISFDCLQADCRGSKQIHKIGNQEIRTYRCDNSAPSHTRDHPNSTARPMQNLSSMTKIVKGCIHIQSIDCLSPPKPHWVVRSKNKPIECGRAILWDLKCEILHGSMSRMSATHQEGM